MKGLAENFLDERVHEETNVFKQLVQHFIRTARFSYLVRISFSIIFRRARSNLRIA